MASNVTITRSTPKAATLENLYRAIWEITQDESDYYTEEDIKALKNNSSNIFYERG